MGIAEEEKKRAQPMGCGFMVFFFLWFYVGSNVSWQRVAPKMCVIYELGWSKVQSEGLYVVKYQKNGPWTLSNGTMFQPPEPAFSLIALGCELALVVAPFMIIFVVLARREEKRSREETRTGLQR